MSQIVSLAESARELHRYGVVLLRGAVDRDAAAAFRTRAVACLGDRDSVRLSEMQARTLVTGDALFQVAMGGAVECRLEDSWIRRKYAPHNTPRGHHPNSWHQDGGLGIDFPPPGGVVPAMTKLVTCWVALDPCGADAPSLEFVRRPMDALLHYTELRPDAIATRFAGECWAPELEPGDALVFLAGSLHRTHITPEMMRDRVSVEYRFFPAAANA